MDTTAVPHFTQLERIRGLLWRFDDNNLRRVRESLANVAYEAEHKPDGSVSAAVALQVNVFVTLGTLCDTTVRKLFDQWTKEPEPAPANPKMFSGGSLHNQPDAWETGAVGAPQPPRLAADLAGQPEMLGVMVLGDTAYSVTESSKALEFPWVEAARMGGVVLWQRPVVVSEVSRPASDPAPQNTTEPWTPAQGNVNALAPGSALTWEQGPVVTSPEFKLCPYCRSGVNPVLDQHDDGRWFYKCSCNVRSRPSGTKDGALAAWNAGDIFMPWRSLR